MAKELPYFRFTAQEWQNGDISLESYAMKGLFIDVCAYYWVQDCVITRKMLFKKFRNARKNLQELFDMDILKHNTNTDEVAIKYLNTQFDLLSKNRKDKQNAGKKGGLKKSSNAKAEPKQKPSYKDKYKDNNKDKEKENKKNGVVYPFDSEMFLKFWDLWKVYKKQEHKFHYKTAVSEQAALKKLVTLGETEEICIKIIEESISNGWKGFFKLNINGQTKSNGSAGATDEQIAEIWSKKFADRNNKV